MPYFGLKKSEIFKIMIKIQVGKAPTLSDIQSPLKMSPVGTKFYKKYYK